MPRQIGKHTARRIIARAAATAAMVCLALVVAACAGAGTGADGAGTNGDLSGSPAGGAGQTYAISFDNGNYDFMRSYEASPDAAPVGIAIADTDGDGRLAGDSATGGSSAGNSSAGGSSAGDSTTGDSLAGDTPVPGSATPAAKGALCTPGRDGTMYLALDASSLLGPGVSDLRAFEADIAVVSPHPDFYAVSGEITALDAGGRTVAGGAWSVYMAEKNPNILRLDLHEALPPGPHNMLILSKTVDNATAAGLAQSALLLSALRFYDADGKLLPVDVDAAFAAPDGFGQPDRSHLTVTAGETALEGARGASSGWGQAVALLTQKNGGAFDAGALRDSIVTVYYASSSPPELILQSWTDGKPDSAGWAKVAPAQANDSGSIAQYTYADMVAAFGSDDMETWLDQLYVGDTGADLKVFSVTIAKEAEE